MKTEIIGHCDAANQGFTVRTGDRIKLMPHTDNWMRGAQYGTVQAISPEGKISVKLDKLRTVTRGYTVDDMRPIDFK
jgi:hypothetical protein